MDPSWALPIFSIILLFGSIFGLYWGARVRKMNMKEYLNVFFIESFDIFIFVFLIGSYLAEAIVATVLHPVNETVINSSARWITHNMVSLLGFICAIQSAKAIIGVFEAAPFLISEKDKNGKTVRKSSFAFFIVMLVAAIITTYLALKVPYWNTSIIAKGLGMTREFDYAWDRLMHPFTDKAIIANWYGFNPQKSVIENFGYNMTASYILMLCHIAGSALKGINAAIDSLVLGVEGYAAKFEKTMVKSHVAANVNSNINNRGNAANTTATGTGTTTTGNANTAANVAPTQESAIHECLKELSEFKDSSGKPNFNKIKDFEAKILEQANKFDPSNWSVILREINQLYDNYLKINKENISDDEKSKKKEMNSYQLKQLIELPMTANGLELAIPN